MIAGPPQLPAGCEDCAIRTPFDLIPPEQYRLLLDDYYVRHFENELRMLEKVADFRRRNPQAFGKVMPHFKRVEASRDPRVQRQVANCVPYAQIKLPPEPPLQLESPAPDDAEVIDYLKHNSFNLDGRTGFVKERLAAMRPLVRPVTCSQCRRGRLHLIDSGVR
jgi:hypothetical protein